MRNHSRCVSFLLSGLLSVSLLAPLSSAQAAYDDGSIRDLVDRVTVLTESVQTESANEDELAKLDEMQAELEDKADAAANRSPLSVKRTAGIRSRSTRRPVGCLVNICAILPTSTVR